MKRPFRNGPALNKTAGVTAADLAGCYGVEIGRWSPAAEFPVPAELELTLDYVRRSPGAHAPVRPGWAVEYVVRQRGSENKGMWSLWRPSDARIIWNNGDIATQAELTLDRKSRNLTGTVRTVDGGRTAAAAEWRTDPPGMEALLKAMAARTDRQDCLSSTSSADFSG